MAVALSVWWIVGWAIAVAVIVLAASLLLAIIGLGRRIVGQADSVTDALDGAREHTLPLYEVTQTNLAVDRIERGLRAVRESRAP